MTDEVSEITEDQPTQTPVIKVIDTRRSEAIAVDIERPAPPFWGTQILSGAAIPWEEVFSYLDLQALFVGQWQFRKPKDQPREEYDAFLQETVRPILAEWKERVISGNLLQPQVIYGYFPCSAAGNTLTVYDWRQVAQNSTVPLADLTAVTSFDFPRQRSGKRLCIADFFAPQESGIIDVFPMQAVTAGEIATEVAQKLFAENKYTEYLYFHGMAVQVAEALAEWTHARIRRELGFGVEEPTALRDVLAQRYRGSRYSFGYPACPHIPDQLKQLSLLEVERINMYMDESEQLYPEQSTTAIITYHPIAKYFSA